jgi:hypothetical protein
LIAFWHFHQEFCGCVLVALEMTEHHLSSISSYKRLERSSLTHRRCRAARRCRRAASSCRPSPSSCRLLPCCPLPSFFRPSPWSCRPSPSTGCPRRQRRATRRQRRATPCQRCAIRRRHRAVALVVPSVVVPSVAVPPVALVVPSVAQQSAVCSLADSKRRAFAGVPAAGCHGLCRFVCDWWRLVGRSTYFTYSHVGYLARRVFILRKRIFLTMTIPCSTPEKGRE